MIDVKEVKVREALEGSANPDLADILPPSYTPRAPSAPPNESRRSYPTEYPLTVWQRAAQEEALANSAREAPSSSGSSTARPYPTHTPVVPSIAGPSSSASSQSHTYYTAPSPPPTHLQPSSSVYRQASTSSAYRQPSTSEYALPIHLNDPRAAYSGTSHVGSSESCEQMTRAEREVLEGQLYEQQLLARCAKGDHEERTEYGEFGKIASRRIPIIGVLFLLFDREKVCARCGIRLKKPKEKDRRKLVAQPGSTLASERSLRRSSSVPH